VTLSHAGKPVPYASSVIETDSSTRSMVADDGRVYLTGLPLKGNLEAYWGGNTGEKCSTAYDISQMDLTKPVVQFDLECQ
jgi:outer membrane usher protein